MIVIPGCLEHVEDQETFQGSTRLSTVNHLPADYIRVFMFLLPH